MNGDGIKDLLVGDRPGTVSFFTRDASGDLSFKEKLKDESGQEIKADCNSSPAIVDWNEDGLLDLVLGGDRGGGFPARLYLNKGTKTAYRFGDYSILKAEGKEIAHIYNHVHVKDLNKDGKKDLIIGESSGRICFYENIGTNAAPELKSMVNLQAGGQVIDVGMAAIVCVADWNDDGAYDLLIGEYDENINFFSGEKTSPVVVQKTGRLTVPCKLKYKGKGKYVLVFNLRGPGEVLIRIYSAKGELVYMVNPLISSEGNNEISLNTGIFAKGLYFIKIQTDGETYTSKFIR